MASGPATVINGGVSGLSEVIVEHFKYKWIIKKFNFLPQEMGECIDSPIFRMANNDGEWKLSLYPQGETSENSNSLGIFLNLHASKMENIKIRVHAEISIPQCAIRRTFVHTFKQAKGYGYDNFMERSELVKSFTPDDTVTIFCQIDVPSEPIWEITSNLQDVEQSFDCSEGQLHHDFHCFFNQSSSRTKFSDISVIVGKRKFPAHKLILATRSSVFSAMFEHEEMRENIQNEVEIEKMEPEVIEAMLEFFYTNEVTNLEELVYGLLEAANKYDVKRLRNMCEKALYKTLTNENAAEILVHSDLHCSYKLKKHVMDFIIDHLVDVVDSESYKEMETKYPALSVELVRSIAARRKLETILSSEEK